MDEFSRQNHFSKSQKACRLPRWDSDLMVNSDFGNSETLVHLHH